MQARIESAQSTSPDEESKFAKVLNRHSDVKLTLEFFRRLSKASLPNATASDSADLSTDSSV